MALLYLLAEQQQQYAHIENSISHRQWLSESVKMILQIKVCRAQGYVFGFFHLSSLAESDVSCTVANTVPLFCYVAIDVG
jgi:hypothetical protein